jgi:lysophospholipase L1-like esterase
MRILIRGGSIPAGAGVTKSYVDLLREHYAPYGIEIINRSRLKETSFEGIETFHLDVASFDPDVLILHFGIDDAYGSVYRSEFKENLVQMVRLAQQRHGMETLLSTSHTFDNPNDMTAVNIYYRAIREVASDLYCDIIPVHIFWVGYLHSRGLNNSEYVQTDTRLPNARGHEIFAEAFIWKLNRILLRMGILIGAPPSERDPEFGV